MVTWPRGPFHGTVRDEAGDVLPGATITVYEAGTVSPAVIYAGAVGGVAIVGSVVTSDSEGRFLFFVDIDDYPVSQLFKIVVSLAGSVSATYDYIACFTSFEHDQVHAITSINDHTSSATPGQMLIADANGLPVDGINTNADVAAAVGQAHGRAHSLLTVADHSDYLATLINPAKGQVISQMQGIVGVGNIKGLWVFDETGAVSTITDRSGNGHTVTLRDGALAPINASTCVPGISGLAPYLTFNAIRQFDTPDHANFSFAGAPFSIVWVGRPDTLPSPLFAKSNWATDFEYLLSIISGGVGIRLLAGYCYNTDGTIYIARRNSINIIGDIGTFHLYGMTYNGGAPVTSIKLYRDGLQVDDNSETAGIFTTMVDSTALPGSYINMGGTPGNPLLGAVSTLMVTSAELTAAQMFQLDKLLRSYAGVSV